MWRRCVTIGQIEGVSPLDGDYVTAGGAVHTDGPQKNLATALMFPFEPHSDGSHEALHHCPPPSIVCCISDLLGVSDHYSRSYSLVPRKVIPFQKNGRQHGVNNFLAWSRAGDSHPELEPALVSALQRLEIKQDAPVKRKKGKTTRMVSLNELEKAKKKAVEDAKKSWVAKRPPKQTPPKTPLMPTSAVQPRTRAVKHMTSSAPADEDLDDSETDQVCISHDILFELI